MSHHVAAWGGLKTLIVGGINDEFKLPLVPPLYDWLLTREVTVGVVQGEEVPYPTYRLALLYNAHDEEGFEVKARGKIDKTMYGEAGVYQLALAMREKYCPTKLEMGPGTVERVRRALRDASARAGHPGSVESPEGRDLLPGGDGPPAPGAATEPEGSGADSRSLPSRG